MIQIGTFASGMVVVLSMLTACAAPGSVSTSSQISSVRPSALASSAGPGSAASFAPPPPPASSASPAAALSSDAGLGDTRPPCAFAQDTPILGPNATERPGTDPAMHKPFGDVGVNFGPQQVGATVVWARLDVVVTDNTPLIPPDPTANPSAYRAAESARPDSEEKLTAGTDPHVARVTLKPFAQGPFVVPAAVLNALPAGVASYTVYLVESVDESVCFGALPNPSLPDAEIGSAYSVIAELVP